MSKTLLYILFALLASCANIIAQEITSRVLENRHEIFLCILVGTLAGLGLKYFLDKKYIFHYEPNSHLEGLWAFSLYTLMGISTTAIFWLTEFFFDAYFQTRPMRYLGAALGLSLGYIIKYQLDKKFVFIER